MKLHIGSQVRAEGWKILDINPGPDVDYVGDCKDVSQFADHSFETIYASHVLEHVPYREIDPTLKGWLRILQPGGLLMVGVPNLDTLSRLYLRPQANLRERFFVIQMIFGGQSDPHDFHYVGFHDELLGYCLREAGFVDLQKVENFGLFDDTSSAKYLGTPISLNMTAKKSA
jgi:predicted SAM-dependent methyltransferase